MTRHAPGLPSASPTSASRDEPAPAWQALSDELSAGPVVWSVCVHELPERARGLGQVADGRPETAVTLEASPGSAGGLAPRLVVLLAAAGALATGRVGRDETMPLVLPRPPSEPRLPGRPQDGRGGLLAALSPVGWSVPDLALAVAATGDADAVATLRGRLGGPEIDALAAAVGLPLSAEVPVAAADIARFVVDLQHGTLVSPSVSAQVRRWLACGRDLSGVGVGLGLDPAALVDPVSPVRLWHAVATERGGRSECGLVEGPRGTYAYAALGGWADRDPDVDDAGRRHALAGAARLGAALRRAVAG